MLQLSGNMDQILTHWRTSGAQWAEYALPKLLIIVLVTLFFQSALRVVTRKLEDFSKEAHVRTGLRAQQLRTLASVIGSVGTVVIYFLAAMQALPLFGVDVKPILASAGIVGLAVGFGAQTLVKDVINGFFILLENQYDLGDTVRIAGVTGTVESMTLRRTTLRDANGAVHVIPNSETKVVTNLTRDWAQINVTVTVDYQEKSERVIQLLQAVAEEMFGEAKSKEQLIAMPEVLGIERVAGAEVDYLMIAKAQPNQQWAVGRELRRRIKETFQKNNVRTPGPAKVVVAEAKSSGKGEE